MGEASETAEGRRFGSTLMVATTEGGSVWLGMMAVVWALKRESRWEKAEPEPLLSIGVPPKVRHSQK